MILRVTLLSAVLLLQGACSNSDFSGAAGVRSRTDSGDDDDDDDDERDTDAGDSDSDGGGDSDAGDSDGGFDSDDGNGDNDGGIDSGSENGEGDDIMTPEDLAKLPGVEVVRVGVNFEDAGLSGDRDHNDAVLCFEGKFKVDSAPGNVVSTRKQTVTGSTFSASGCKHNVRVEIVHEDGSRETPITFASNSGQQVTMNFKKGSKLEVFMTATSGCSPGVEKNMHNNIDAKVEPDVCRDSGG